MKNKINSIENHSEELLQAVLKNNLEEVIEVYIALSNTSKQYNDFLDDQVYGYKYKEIPIFLKKECVLKDMREVEADHVNLGEKRWETTTGRALEYLNTPREYRAKMFNNKLKGLFKIKFIRVIAEEWLEKRGIKIQTTNLVQKDYKYQGYELHINQSDSTICTLDLSKCPELRPVFETFYSLSNQSNKTEFTQGELLQRYIQITGKSINWKLFMNRKSTIYGKLIKPKACLMNRICWGFSRKTKLYFFHISPLSDTASDSKTINQ